MLTSWKHPAWRTARREPLSVGALYSEASSTALARPFDGLKALLILPAFGFHWTITQMELMPAFSAKVLWAGVEISLTPLYPHTAIRAIRAIHFRQFPPFDIGVASFIPHCDFNLH
jgi:hypothetical protein